jgi:predicted ABC-type sugar transport system permease subunit
MPRLTIYLARFIGLFLLIVSVSMFLDRDSIIEMATALIDDRALLLIVGLIALGIGLAIVVGHNVWSGGPMPIIITLFGWSQTLRGAALLLLPAETQIAFFQVMRLEDFFYIYAGIPLVIGAYLTYAGFTSQYR